MKFEDVIEFIQNNQPSGIKAAQQPKKKKNKKDKLQKEAEVENIEERQPELEVSQEDIFDEDDDYI